MARVLVGGLVGGVVLFVWQFAAWMFLGIHDLEREPVLPNEAALVAALEGVPRGVYWVPGLPMAEMKAKGDAYKAWEARHEKGPRTWINHDPQGSKPMDTRTFGIGGALAIAVALVAAILLRAASIGSYLGRALFVAGLGLFLAVAMDAQNWNWMHFPPDWTRGFVLDHLGGMAALGLVLGGIVKPKP